MIKIKIKKGKKRENKKKRANEEKEQVRKKKRKKKRKVSCLVEKPTCFWKQMTSNFSLKKFTDHNQFLKKWVYT